MRIRVDKENDALYFRFDEAKIMESEEVEPGVILDYDANEQVVGIEILG
ncbi:amino acid permease family protein, partial [delta proteobacterium NaphS2]